MLADLILSIYLTYFTVSYFLKKEEINRIFCVIVIRLFIKCEANFEILNPFKSNIVEILWLFTVIVNSFQIAEIYKLCKNYKPLTIIFFILELKIFLMMYDYKLYLIKRIRRKKSNFN